MWSPLGSKNVPLPYRQTESLQDSLEALRRRQPLTPLGGVVDQAINSIEFELRHRGVTL